MSGRATPAPRTASTSFCEAGPFAAYAAAAVLARLSTENE
jgi:hypothetical protein